MDIWSMLKARLEQATAAIDGHDGPDCWEAARPFLRCHHEHMRLGYIACANGVRQYRHECVICGYKGNAIRTSSLTESEKASAVEIPAGGRDDTPWSQYRTAVQECITERRNADYAESMEVERERYAEWLSRSDEWADMREKVIRRDGGLCQGCLTACATQVHHLDYRDKYAPFAFQLVALCDKCHTRYHGIE